MPRLAKNGYGLIFLAALAALAPLLIALPARGGEPYLEIAARWSPDVWQDTWYYPEADYLAAFNGDGDWIGANNQESLAAGKFAPYRAYVYYEVMETRTHYLVLYEFFHPYDYDRKWMKAVPGAYHENDTEGIMLVLQKTGKGEEFRLLMTKPHGYTRHYITDPSVKPKKPLSAGRPRFRDGTHPQIYIQQGGHGPYALGSRAGGVLKRKDFRGGTGVEYRYKAKAEEPKGPSDRDVGYDLILVSGDNGFWPRRHQRETFSQYRAYVPPPGAHGVPPELTANGLLPFALDGDAPSKGGEKGGAGAPWRHFGLDPARAISSQWSFPEGFSTDYAFNPYLGIDERSVKE